MNNAKVFQILRDVESGIRRLGISSATSACHEIRNLGIMRDSGLLEEARQYLKATAKENDELLKALKTIAEICEGSTTANSLPHVAKIARAAIAKPVQS